MSMRTKFARVWCVLALCLMCVPSLAAQQNQAAPEKVLEQGTFRLHKFEQAIGEETYTIGQDGDTLVVNSNFRFKDRFTEVPLTTKLEFASDLTPRSSKTNFRTAASASAALAAPAPWMPKLL